MIPRPEKRTPVEAPAAAPELPHQMVEVREFEFNFGPNDTHAVTLLPDDTFEYRLGADGGFRIVTADGEMVTIDASRVRWWSQRTRKVAMPIKPFEPADPGLSV
jgi:hypothetical protein